ncbi:YqiA/YcfP family alpha/beta fold hydrolase [Phocaeicola vulgatus]|jgi:bacteriophage protein GP30.3|uniref:YqiA/YcfP family alpha/beta fold hydrolase n=1 Tax=Bacteroidaceae TaxID=815 RepID=UPI00094B08AC|nr:YqiA/YcfP family alpha/beta fold hydrolase [Bacteroides togonis]
MKVNNILDNECSRSKDYFDPVTNTIDIRSDGLYPSNVLSNLCSNGFRFEGMVCGSMEGFLQSLKRKDPNKQRQICSMKGGNARKMSVTFWQTEQIVWWKGQAIDRQSNDFRQLIHRAYKAMFDQNERFRTALMQTRGIALIHTSGEDNPYKTILTPTEFCGILMDIRDSYDLRDKTQELKEKSVRRKKLLYMHGFGSSAASGTVTMLRKHLPGFDVVAPDIPVDPAEGLPFLRGLCMNEQPDVVVGTSMGGMYALQMHGYKRICVNPAFEMSNKSKVLTTGIHEYSNPRKDSSTHFEITSDTIRHFAEMEEHQFDAVTDVDRKQVWGMFADNDTQVDEEPLFLQHYTQVIHFSGEHRLDEAAIKNVLVPLIHNIVQ